MRHHKTAAKGLKTPKTPVEVLRLLGEGLEALILAKKSGTAVGNVPTVRFKEFVEELQKLELREVLHILCGVGSLARQLAPFDTFPTKKVRFNVYPESMEKLARVAKACGTKTKKSSMDTVLEFLFNGLPLNYWDCKSEVATLLSEHLPTVGHTTPVSLAMNGLGYALLQELAELLGESQGAVLEAAIEMWLADLEMRKAKRKEALKIITEFESQAGDVEDHLQKILDGDDPVCSRFGMVMVELMNLRSSIEDNINEEVPIYPHYY